MKRERSPDQLPRQSNRARKLAREADRQQRKMWAAEDACKAALDELCSLHAAESERLGVELPFDPFILDVVAAIDVEPGDVWRWRGQRNNKGLPVVRTQPHRGEFHEVSATRLLAVALGVISETDDVMLYPTGDRDDVNPAHRTLRPNGGARGNPHRYRGRPREKATR